LAETGSRLRFAGRLGGWFGVVLAVAGLWLGWRGLLARAGAQAEAPAAAGRAGAATVHALARLEPIGGLVVVGVRPGTRIDQVLVAQGDVVKAGWPLGVIEGHEAARCQLALAEARKSDAACRRARERRRVALQREREDELQKARKVMLDDILRALKLQDDRLDGRIRDFPQEYRSELRRELDALKSKLDQLRIEEHKALFEREQWRIDQQLKSRKRGQEDEALADGGTEDQLLDRQIEIARATFAATTVKAPIAATVLEVMAHAGEISSGPLLALGDLTAVAAIAEVDQTDVGSVREGDAATAAVLGAVVPGRVTRIGRLVGRHQLTNIDPRAPQDLRVVKVTVRLDRAEPAARLMNLQVEVVITPREAER
jgi:HlyD family secretion protein